MNSDSLVALLQKSFHVTLGATASLVEVLQDPMKRDENLSKLRTELGQLSQEWAEKGEITEQEARRFVDGLMTQTGQNSPSPNPPTSASPTVTAPPPAPEANTQVELQELTAQIAAIRTELEKLREQESKS